LGGKNANNTFMIASLNGTVIYRERDSLILDVGGVGRMLLCPHYVLQSFPEGDVDGIPLRLFVETIVREGEVSYYGFPEMGQCRLFRLVISVQGVGGRVALNLFSALGYPGLVRCLSTEDARELTQAEGVGARLAERMVRELRGKVDVSIDTPCQATTKPPKHSHIATGIEPSPLEAKPRSLLMQSLAALGYSRPEAASAVQAVLDASSDETSLEELLKACLHKLAGGGKIAS
jgi:Holliday junction DNA helicase RuvA